ncbi:hypothetical protein H0H87_010591 [Tephrocybe sp. NHM501043]|nr:hypothetical protein H0H87_010591 [Tephrocybe sp. NHM501043]
MPKQLQQHQYAPNPAPTPTPPPQSPSPAPSISVSSSTSKLPKFLRAPGSRDRAKSVAEASTTSLASTSSEGSSKGRKSRFLGRRSADVTAIAAGGSGGTGTLVDEAPIIVEPVPIPHSRRTIIPSLNSNSSSQTSPTSPSSASPPMNALSHMSLYASTPTSSSSSSRIGDLPTRLSGWFSHTFSSSSTDLSLPSLLAASTSSSNSNFGMGTSPKRSAGASALLAAAKHGKGHLDKAFRYLLDSDATPDKCTDPIWILGVKHVGWEPPLPTLPSVHQANLGSSTRSLRSSVSSASDITVKEGGGNTGKGVQGQQQPQWPLEFYADFTSRVWLTYRSQFEPIRDGRLADLTGESAEYLGGYSSNSASTPVGSGGGRHREKEKEKREKSEKDSSRRQWAVWGGGEKGWTSDSGWGCMLRTGQSLLANALVHLHLGRDWRRPPQPVHTADYATYVQILTWFLDTPRPEAPFSVHRMALAGKELGKDVGQWFGPSTAAGAIKTLVNGYSDAGLGVAVATDGVLFQNEVFTASHTGAASVRSPRRHTKALAAAWGDRPVLLLVGVRLGLDGVNPIYYETIKVRCYSLLQRFTVFIRYT